MSLLGRRRFSTASTPEEGPPPRDAARARTVVSGRSPDRQRAILKSATGQLLGRLRAGSRGRCHDTGIDEADREPDLRVGTGRLRREQHHDGPREGDSRDDSASRATMVSVSRGWRRTMPGGRAGWRRRTVSQGISDSIATPAQTASDGRQPSNASDRGTDTRADTADPAMMTALQRALTTHPVGKYYSTRGRMMT